VVIEFLNVEEATVVPKPLNPLVDYFLLLVEEHAFAEAVTIMVQTETVHLVLIHNLLKV